MKWIIVLLALATARMPEKKPVMHTVKMEEMSFSPQLIEVRGGDKVRWTNESNGSHNVIANNGLFKSEMLEGKGTSFEFTFTEAGTYSYFCRPHRIMGMKGKVVVKE